MTENKQFVYYEHKGADYILENPNTELDFIEMLGDCLEAEEIVDKLNELVDENEQLKEERDYFERKKCEYFNKYNKKHLDNIQLKEFIYELYKKYEDAHGMSIENEDWF